MHRQPPLAVKDRAAILHLDGQRREGKQRAEHHQRRATDHNIQRALEKTIPDRGRGAIAIQKGQPCQMHLRGPAEQQITDLGPDIGRNAPLYAQLQQRVALGSVEPAQDHCLRAVQQRG